MFSQQSDEISCLRNKRIIVTEQDQDENRLLANLEFINSLDSVIISSDVYSFPWDSIPFFGAIKSRDNQILVLNWNVPIGNQEQLYYGYVIRKVKRKQVPIIYKLFDKRSELTNLNKELFNESSWPGALYYEIIQPDKKRNKTYTLLGWDGNDALTNRKVIEVISFEKDKIVFGASLFYKDDRTLGKRYYFEFSQDANMSLKYHPKRNEIIFDHLAPPNPELKGVFQFYGPDLSYDSFKWEKNKWIFYENIDVSNDNHKVYSPKLKKEKDLYNPNVKGN